MNLNLDSVRMHPLEDINIVDTTIANTTSTSRTTTTTTIPTSTTSITVNQRNDNISAAKTTPFLNNILKTANANKTILIHEIEMVSLNKTLLPS